MHSLMWLIRRRESIWLNPMITAEVYHASPLEIIQIVLDGKSELERSDGKMNANGL